MKKDGALCRHHLKFPDRFLEILTRKEEYDDAFPGEKNP